MLTNRRFSREVASRDGDRRKLLESVLVKAKTAPFYREALGGCDSWDRVPLTTKDDLRAAYPFGLLAVPRDRLATYHESSGSSGEPTSTYLTDGDWDDIATRFARNAVDLSSRDTVLVKTPYSLVTTAHQMHRAARMRGAFVVPADNRSSNMPYSKVVRLLKDLSVTVAWCMPSEALIWAQAAQAAGLDPARDFPAFRAFVVAGEALTPARKRRISELWGGIKVFEDYGSTETGSLAGDCSHGNLHAWSDRLHFEVIEDSTTKRCSKSIGGEGSLAVTPLYREGQALLRYLIGDRVRLGVDSCACGSELPVLRVLGRAGSAVRVGDGQLLPADLEDAVYSLPLSYGVVFWRARPEGTRLAIEFECPPGEAPRATESLIALLRERLALSVTARALLPGTLLPKNRLVEPSSFLKPRFLFAERESWEHGLAY